MTRSVAVSASVAAALLGAAALDGGYTPVAWGWTALALVLVVCAGLVLQERPALPRAGVVVLAALAGLLAWQSLSLAWTVSVPLTALQPELTLVALAGTAAALLWLHPDDLPAAAAGVLGAATLLSLWNLVTRGGAATGSGQDAAPIGYANSLGLVAAVGILLAAGLALEQRGAARLLPLACAAPCGAVLWLSGSRGALVALLAGAAVALAARLPIPRLPTPRLRMPLVALAGLGAALVLGFVGSAERRAYWTVSVGEAGRQPLLGSGAGTWVRAWLEHRQELFPARDAHSLYLQTLAELGPPGLALVLLALVPPLVLACHLRPRPLVAATAGAYAAFVVHLGVDFDWELAAVSLTGLVLGAALLAAASPRRPVPVAPFLGVAAAAGLAGAYLLAGNLLTARAGEALHRGAAASALVEARRASRLAPWASEPWRLAGEAERAIGRDGAAAASFRRGIALDGGDVELWRALARVTRGEERRRALAVARRLDPVSARAVAAGAAATASG